MSTTVTLKHSITCCLYLTMRGARYSLCLAVLLSFSTNVSFGTNVSINPNNVTDLYIGVLLPMSNHWWVNYAQFLPILLKHAFDEVERRDDILPGYRLNMVIKDTQGVAGRAAQKLSELVTEEPTKIAIFGPALSEEANIVGQVTPWYNLIQMMFLARTSSLSNREIYSSVYLTNYLEEQFNEPKIELMREFGWQRVATLTQLVDLFTSSTDALHTLLESSNLTLVTSGVIVNHKEVAEQISRLKQYDARIIFGSFHSSTLPYVFCEAYKQGLYGHQYVWVLSGPSTYSTWITSAKPDVTCTSSELYMASNGYFTFDIEQLGRSNSTTISQRTPVEFEELLKSLNAGSESKISSSNPFAYDAVWALVLALNDTMDTLESQGILLEDFSYNNSIIYEALKESFKRISFLGVSGPVSYGLDGQRIGHTYLRRQLDNKTTTFASYYPGDGVFSWFADSTTIWDGNPPKDRFTYINTYPGMSYATAITVISLASLGFVMAVGFLAFNVSYRNIRPIKMSSPNMNNMIIGGCMLMYVSVYLQAVDVWRVPDSDTSTLCMIRIWVVSLAFTLAFGAIFSKTWRVHILFRSTELKRKHLRDYKLFGLVGLLILIDLLILIPWSLVHPLREKHEEFNQEVLADGDVIATETYIICHNDSQTYWLSAQYIYKGLLLAFGTFLAWETRQVRIPALNDSREIGFCVYNVVVVCVFGVPVYHLLSANQSNLRFAISSALIIFCTTLVLCIVFVPKILRRNDIEKPGVFLTVDGTSKSRNAMTSSAPSTQNCTKTSRVGPEPSTTGIQAVNSGGLFLVPDNTRRQENVDSTSVTVT